MRSITIHLAGVIEEREHDERRRTRRRVTGFAIVAIAAVIAAMQPEAATPRQVAPLSPRPSAIQTESGVWLRPAPLPLSPPHSVVAPESLRFASQMIGIASQPQLIDIKSDGDEPLEIGRISVDGDAFRMTNGCAKLDKGSNCTIAISFTPASAGPQAGRLTISSNAGTTTIPLAGIAVSLPPVDLGSIDFGRVPSGTASESRSVRFTNSGPLTMAIEIGVLESAYRLRKTMQILVLHDGTQEPERLTAAAAQ